MELQPSERGEFIRLWESAIQTGTKFYMHLVLFHNTVIIKKTFESISVCVCVCMCLSALCMFYLILDMTKLSQTHLHPQISMSAPLTEHVITSVSTLPEVFNVYVTRAMHYTGSPTVEVMFLQCFLFLLYY